MNHLKAKTTQWLPSVLFLLGIIMLTTYAVIFINGAFFGLNMLCGSRTQVYGPDGAYYANPDGTSSCPDVGKATGLVIFMLLPLVLIGVSLIMWALKRNKLLAKLKFTKFILIPGLWVGGGAALFLGLSLFEAPFDPVELVAGICFAGVGILACRTAYLMGKLRTKNGTKKR